MFPIRGPPGVEMLPKLMSSVVLSLEGIRKIKGQVGGSVNDVVMGVVFCGFRWYCQTVLPVSKQIENLRVTALGLLNLRSQAGIKSGADATSVQNKSTF
ncbi:hypothetical protein SUGI_0846600 [Cryptomeria japonica]|nr:hypothetical protein SUGI_0846600 [Cryptomeria japonica]